MQNRLTARQLLALTKVSCISIFNNCSSLVGMEIRLSIFSTENCVYRIYNTFAETCMQKNSHSVWSVKSDCLKCFLNIANYFKWNKIYPLWCFITWLYTQLHLGVAQTDGYLRLQLHCMRIIHKKYCSECEFCVSRDLMKQSLKCHKAYL